MAQIIFGVEDEWLVDNRHHVVASPVRLIVKQAFPVRSVLRPKHDEVSGRYAVLANFVWHAVCGGSVVGYRLTTCITFLLARSAHGEAGGPCEKCSKTKAR